MRIFLKIFLLPLAAMLTVVLLILLYAHFVDGVSIGITSALSMTLFIFLWIYFPPALLTALVVANIKFKPMLASYLSVALIASIFHVGWPLLFLDLHMNVFLLLIPLSYTFAAWRALSGQVK